jgi:cell division protein ZapB
LTAPGTAPIVAAMKGADASEQLRQLGERVERLVELTRRLADENRSLRTSQDQLIGERAALLTKNEQARSRVEAMIQRLKSLEQNA